MGLKLYIQDKIIKKDIYNATLKGKGKQKDKGKDAEIKEE